MPLPYIKNKEFTQKESDPTFDNRLLPEQMPTPPTPEAYVEAVEQPKETEIKLGEEKKENVLDDAITNLKNALRKTKQKPMQIPQVRDEVTLRVEKIMEEGLGDAFKEMTPVQQQEFKIKGEQIAQEIRDLMRGNRLKVKKIFSLILDWLKLLPGVNKFFLEQEAKIKADKIIAIKKMNDKF